jgi:hypothetical protein
MVKTFRHEAETLRTQNKELREALGWALEYMADPFDANQMYYARREEAKALLPEISAPAKTAGTAPTSQP